MKVRELIKVLEKDGWQQVRMRGNHRQFRHSVKTGTVTVAVSQVPMFLLAL